MQSLQPLFDGFESDYARRKERERARQAEQSRTGRDIGPLPPVADPEAAERCSGDLRAFLERYLAATFCLEWSSDHLRVIETLERVILDGGQYALAMPRGNGKTSLVIGATIWAAVYGHRRFIVPIAATGPKAKGMLESIKAAIESNETLGADFPAVCHPVRKLEGVNNRAPGQTLAGERTHIKWTGERLFLPTIPNAPSSGVIVQAAGLLGSIRGMQQMRQDGETVRPDLVLLDDPQTDESARRPAQTERRLKVIEDTVLSLAGPNIQIAAICPCTVIQPDDLADRLLDPENRPEWQGFRTALLRSMPDDLATWAKYREIRQDSLREHGDIREATAYYQANREAMDRGADASWPARFKPGQLSAVQYAMDLWAVNESGFQAEYQNDPRHDEQDGIETLRAADLLGRCDGSQRGAIPDWAGSVTAFADIQQDILPYMVVAWGKDLRGRILDYGGWPQQQRRYYTLREVSPTLREVAGAATVEDGIAAGIETLHAHLLEKYPALKWFGLDANWQISTETVYAAARRHPLIMPFHGRFVGAASLPMANWKRKPGEKPGHFWRTSTAERCRVVTVDINTWKSFTLVRLREDPDSGRGVTWFGDKPYQHEMLCDQLSAEFGVVVSGRGRRVTEWKNRPGRDNHLWDCLIGCAVGASITGLELPGQTKPPQAKRLSAEEIRKLRRGE